MLPKLLSNVGLRVCWSNLSLAEDDEERASAMREFERIWVPGIKDWRRRLVEYAMGQGDSEVVRFLESYLDLNSEKLKLT